MAEPAQRCAYCEQPLVYRQPYWICQNLRCEVRGLDARLLAQFGRPGRR